MGLLNVNWGVGPVRANPENHTITTTQVVNPASPMITTREVNPASPTITTREVNPASPMTTTREVNPASPTTTTREVNPASPMTITWVVNPASRTIRGIRGILTGVNMLMLLHRKMSSKDAIDTTFSNPKFHVGRIAVK